MGRWLIVVALLVAGACSSDETDAEADKLSAFNVCQDFVEDRLKAPGTASYPNFFEDDGEVVVTGSGDGPYTVRSHVDAENSFGAELRLPFTCEVRKGSGDNWRLIDLDLSG
jgi:hypothetical protein